MTVTTRAPKPETEAGKRGRGEGGRSPRRGRGEDGDVRVEGEVGEDGDLLLLRGGGRSPTAAAPPQTTAAAPPQTAPPQACATRRSGEEGEGGGAEASGGSERRRARRLGFGRGREVSRVGEKKERGTVLPPRCASIVQKRPQCHLDNNLDIAQWF
jgi:hypothetical protein